MSHGLYRFSAPRVIHHQEAGDHHEEINGQLWIWYRRESPSSPNHAVSDHYPGRGNSSQAVQVWDVTLPLQLTANRRVQFSILDFSDRPFEGRFFLWESMKGEVVAIAVKAAPAVDGNFWLLLEPVAVIVI